MISRLFIATLLCFFVVMTDVQAQVVPATVSVSTPVSAANAFQVIDDVRAENGDADLAYIRATVARNEAAIDAAKAILKTSFDADIRMMAGDSMKLHDSELRTLKAWLRLHGAQAPLLPAETTLPPQNVTPTQLKLPTTGQAPTPLPAAVGQTANLSSTIR